MPFSLFTSYDALTKIRSPPPRSSFISELSNNGGEPISQSQYDDFCWSWSTLRCDSLLSLESHYIRADTLQVRWLFRPSSCRCGSQRCAAEADAPLFLSLFLSDLRRNFVFLFSPSSRLQPSSLVFLYISPARPTKRPPKLPLPISEKFTTPTPRSEPGAYR